MITDLRSVAWKEWRSLLGGRARRQILIVGGMLAIQAIWFPIQMGGRDYLSDPVLPLILAIVLPMAATGILVPDSIAGERERHTLGTLLASRLPDRAILVGKLGFGVVVGWLALPLMLLVALIVSNLTALADAPIFYDPLILAVDLTLGLLVAVLTGAIAIFVSLRASTAQEAQQLTLVGLMTPFMVIGFGLTIVFANRELAGGLLDALAGDGAWLALAAVLTVLVAVDVVLVIAAGRRFRRGRLVAEVN